MANEIKVFENEEFGSVRTVMMDSEVWFVGKDVAEILGYSDTNKAVAMHVDTEDKKLNDKTSSSFGQRGATLINESGLYSLTLLSKLPSAKKFKRWVTNEVLPSIRKHGAYMTEQTIEKALTNPDFLIKLATELKQEQEKRKALEQKVEEDKPKIEYHDCVLNKSGLMATSIIAKDLGMSAQKLNKILNDKKIIYKDSTKVWKVYADYEWLMTEGYADYVSYTEEGVKPSLKWTEKGRQWIMKQLGCA